MGVRALCSDVSSVRMNFMSPRHTPRAHAQEETLASIGLGIGCANVAFSSTSRMLGDPHVFLAFWQKLIFALHRGKF